MPYYAVAKGAKVGIYMNWDDCKANVSGYRGATFKKFNSAAEAKEFIERMGDPSSSSQDLGPSSSVFSGSYPKSIPRYASSSSARSKFSGSGDLRSKSFISSSHPESKVSKHSQRGPRPVFEASDSVNIYVDGACRGNGREAEPAAGYGVYYGNDSKRNASVPLSKVDTSGSKPTNQRAELYAMKHALSDIHDDLSKGNIQEYIIHTDSQYTRNALTSWSQRWKRNGWKNSKGDAVSNSDIIKDSLELMDGINNIYEENGHEKLRIEHVKGHSGIHGNEQADKLANLGADFYEFKKR